METCGGGGGGKLFLRKGKQGPEKVWRPNNKEKDKFRQSDVRRIKKSIRQK